MLSYVCSAGNLNVDRAEASLRPVCSMSYGTCITRWVLGLLNFIDMAVGIVLVFGGLLVLFKWDLRDEIYLWLPLFIVGGLLLFMVITSTFGLDCCGGCHCCVRLSEVIGFVIAIAELSLAVIIFGFKSTEEKILDSHYVNRLQNVTIQHFAPESEKSFADFDTAIGITLFVLFGLQIVRIISGSVFSKQRKSIHGQWEDKVSHNRSSFLTPLSGRALWTSCVYGCLRAWPLVAVQLGVEAGSGQDVAQQPVCRHRADWECEPEILMTAGFFVWPLP